MMELNQKKPMPMSSDDLISAAMLQWEERWRQGDEPPVAELCADHPELADKLKHEIAAIKGMSWLDEVERIVVVDSPTHALPRNGTGHLPASSLSVDEFAESICRSGLLTSEEMKKFQEMSLDGDIAGDATSFAEKLVSDGRLTKYQASVVLEERSEPLLIDRYIILDTLGSGGMGLVFKALHKAMDRVVALKILPPWCVDSPDKVQRFQREAKAAAKLSHPNIVAVFDADQSDDTHFLAMEYVQGQNLYNYVRQHGPLRVGQAINRVIQAARGLEHAHQHGVIHRDIKPSNLMLTHAQVTPPSKGNSGDNLAAPTVKVLDMGLALIDSPTSFEQTAQELTQGGILLGTIAYISPEQALDTRQADARSDVYSLGATLHFLLTGRPPYNEATAMKTLMAHREAPIPSLGEKRDDVPTALEAAYQRMLSKRPDDRFASMRELIETLEAITLDGDDESAWLPPIVVLDDDTDLVEMAGEETVALPHGGQTKGLSAALKSGGWRIVLGCLLVITLGAGGYSYFGTTLFKIDTTAGTLIVEVDQPGASVEVDGKRLTITQPGSKQPLTIDLDEGQHRLVVRKDGFDLFSKEITIDSGGRQSIRVRLEPLSEKSSIAKANSAEQPTPTNNWQPTPEQQAFFDTVARLAPPAQVHAVVDKLKQINPEFRGTVKIEMTAEKGAKLIVRGGWFTDMWPLTKLTNVSLDAEITPQTDLSPLANLSLQHLSGVSVSPVNERAPDLVAALPRLKTINGVNAETWLARRQEVEDLRQILTALAPKTQLAQVMAKLKEYNPGFDGELTDYKIEDGKVVRIDVQDKPHLLDLSPLGAFPKLQELSCTSTGVADLSPLSAMPLEFLHIMHTGVTDLSPLKGMSLTVLYCSYTDVSDLTPLQGMPLQTLSVNHTRVSDLSPIKDSPLRRLECDRTRVRDLSPLRGLPLTHLQCSYTPVSDLSPLQGMSLKTLHFSGTQVADFSPLKNMPLESLNLHQCSHISDLSPLQGMPLVSLNCRNSGISDFSVLNGLPLERIAVRLFLFDDAQQGVLKSLPLKTIDGFGGGQSATDFWKQVAARRKAAEEFRDVTAVLRHEEQVAVVAARLKELNPVGNITLKTIVESGDVVAATLGGKPNDATPLMAFTKLERLTFSNPDPGGWQYLDLSPISMLPLKELICPDVIALGNAAVLRKSETLQTINGQPAADYLDALRKSD